jgi:GNAT superfamily N-acetyltransferase
VIEIVPFEPQMAEAVTACYNEIIEPVPDCYPATVDRFATLAGLAHCRLRDEEMMVARDDGEAAGFVHVGIALPGRDDEEPKGEPGAIRSLAYRPGDRSIGQSLLDWAEKWARERGREAIAAWEAALRYPFYHFGYAHLSEKIGHVRALFGMNGYREVGGEIYLTWRDFTPPQAPRPEPELELRVKWEEGHIGPRLEVAGKRGRHTIGECRVDRGRHSGGPGASDWCYCDSLWVTESLRGKRVGAFLLGTALHEMKDAGCRHAAISTGASNYRAQLMYTNMGYRVTDCTICLRKEL